MPVDNGWSEYSKLVLGQLENLANNIQVLNSQIQELKQERIDNGSYDNFCKTLGGTLEEIKLMYGEEVQ